MYFIYILYSKDFDRYYVGQCEDLKARLRRHNARAVPSTKSFASWQMVHTESFSTSIEAMQRETEIKKKKSKEYIESLLDGGTGRHIPI